MSKKELKLQNKNLEIHVVDVISKFDPSQTGKFTKFLIDLLKNRENQPKLRKARDRFNTGYQPPRGENNIEEVLIEYLGSVYGRENLEALHSFHNHLDNNRIDEGKRDINQYSGWDDIHREVSMATIRYEQKRLEKEVIKVMETEEWLVIRPLTFESSLTYGAGTKWCTASKSNRDYFYQYCHKGVLSYVINKKTGDKYGVFYDINSNHGEFSVWNAPDKRIDSIESTIPVEIMKDIFNMSKSEYTNAHYFSDDEHSRWGGYGKKQHMTEAEAPTPMNEPMVVGWEGDAEEISMEEGDEYISEDPTIDVVERAMRYLSDRVGEIEVVESERPRGNWEMDISITDLVEVPQTERRGHFIPVTGMDAPSELNVTINLEGEIDVRG